MIRYTESSVEFNPFARIKYCHFKFIQTEITFLAPRAVLHMSPCTSRVFPVFFFHLCHVQKYILKHKTLRTHTTKSKFHNISPATNSITTFPVRLPQCFGNVKVISIVLHKCKTASFNCGGWIVYPVSICL